MAGNPRHDSLVLMSEKPLLTSHAPVFSCTLVYRQIGSQFALLKEISAELLDQRLKRKTEMNYVIPFSLPILTAYSVTIHQKSVPEILQARFKLQ